MGYPHNGDEDFACTKWTFPHNGFWLIHTLGPLLIFLFGVRFAARRVPVLPLLALRVFRMLRER